MTGHLRICIFGDQTWDLQSHIKKLFHLRDNAVVEDFLTKAYDAVRKEIYSLQPELRDAIPRFTSLNDLILYNQGSGPRCVAIDLAIHCMYHLGTFISEADSWYHGDGDFMVVGLCLGGLASAAVSHSSTALELVPKAVDAVATAFRMGLHGSTTARHFAASHDLEKSWSTFFGGVSLETVSQLCQQSIFPSTSRPYISAVAANGITVSGPPASLEQLAGCKRLDGVRSKSLPVFAPFHASHIYSKADVDEIVGDGRTNIARRQRQILFLSSSGKLVDEAAFPNALNAAVDAIMVQPMELCIMIEQLVAILHEQKPGSLEIIPIGTSMDRAVLRALKGTSLNELLTPDVPQSIDPKLSASNPKTPKLAIIGMSGRFPGGANSTDSFWELLSQGLDVHKVAPPLRWDVNTHVDLTGKHKNTGRVPYGCWLEDAGLFDAKFFNISPREAPQIDPAQRLAMMTVYEAVERAGIVADATPSTRRDRVGVFYGVTGNDWVETNSAQDIDTYLIPGGNRAFIPGRINYFYKFSGPSYAVDTACSSAMSAFHIACNSLWRGDIDTAIAGGTNFMTNPDYHAGLDRGHFLSRTGNCKTFDDTADGYCRGEGVGTVIFKRLDDAIADNDPILAVILDSYTNHSSESESITRPHVGAQCAIFGKILNEGAVDPYSVSYVEMHGTGTQAGDATEMASVLHTFAPSPTEAPRKRSNDQALYLGSAKANIGHGEASSGSSALIKVLLMMQHNTIVPHCGIKTKINHKFPTDLKERKVNIASKLVPWERSSDPNKPRRALINNFSAAGGNSAILIEDAPLLPPVSDSDNRNVHLVTVSARSPKSLQANITSMFNFLKLNPDTRLGQLSYTTTARRMHHQHRVAISGSTADELCIQLQAALKNDMGVTRPKSRPKVIFTFTGQGAQYPGMGKQLLNSFKVFRKEIQQLQRIAKSLGFPEFLHIIEADENEDLGDFEPIAIQLANICLQIALCRLWACWGVTPVAVLGHSLGEYAALNAAGVLSDADTIFLVGKRAECLQSQCTRGTHAMLVVRGSVSEIETALGGKVATHNVEFACINSPVETVLAGTKEAIDQVAATFSNMAMKSTVLKVPYAFHSSQMDPILSDLEDIADHITFSRPQIPVLSTLDSIAVSDSGVFSPAYIVRHSREPVNMLEALVEGQNSNIITDNTTMIEIGPHPAIGGMIRAVLGSQVSSLASYQRARSVWQVLAVSLKHLYAASADLRWSEYHRDFTGSHKVLQLPSYGWDMKDYWIPYVHDWSLRKGDPPLQVSGGGSSLYSTTIHNVVKETEVSSSQLKLVVEADIQRPDLSPLVQGHEVDGVPLCTPSVYGDIALSLGTYLLRRYRPEQSAQLVDVTDMTIIKALILRATGGQQLLQAHADIDWKSNSAVVIFMSFDNKQKLQEHSRCTLRFKDRQSLQTALQKDVTRVTQRLKDLRNGVATGDTARYNRAMAYRAIRPLAKFHPDYRAVEEAILDSNSLECSSRLDFTKMKKGGNFHTHPAIIDAFTQCCGFTMNCNDDSDLDEDIYMNHGWGSLQLFEPINLDKSYRTYNIMKEGPDKLYYGDVVVLDDSDKVVAFFGQIAIQRVARRVLKVILSIESGTKSQNRIQTAKKESTAQSSISRSQTKNDDTAAPVSNNDKGTLLFKKANSEPESVADIGAALSIIAEESGIAVTDLTDATDFADAGIDSLLGLTISARFKEELNLDIDINDVFAQFPTVGKFKAYLSENESLSSNSGGTSTPSSNTTQSAEMAESSATSVDNVSIDDKLEEPSSKINFDGVLQVIAEESGVAIADLTDDTNFADAGVDSLLGLVITRRLQDEMDLDIEMDSLLMNCPTVADLRKSLLGAAVAGTTELQQTVGSPAPEPDVSEKVGSDNAHQAVLEQISALNARQEAVENLVERYTSGFSASGPSLTSSWKSADNEKVVLMTGATGSLGSYLAFTLAQRPDVKTVVCLNREHRDDPYTRQVKKMREKGIRFPDALKEKMLVLQTNTSKPQLGLEADVYENLVGSVTHIIHSAWPMSGKRTLDGFEPQFQVMQSLIQLTSDITSRRPSSFKVTFQMVSSIGVVGLYGLNDNPCTKTVVPEASLGFDSVLPNGYGEAKWGCERMLDKTLRKHPDTCRTMVVRLGQIAGSRGHGYWNPMEHIGFLIKSSQTVKALPDLRGDVRWTPVEDVAGTLIDLALAGSEISLHPFYHIDNPISKPWTEVNAVVAECLDIPELIPFKDWVERIREAPQRNNPAATLMEFWDDNFIRMGGGGLVLGIENTLEHSETLSSVTAVSDKLLKTYIHIWKEIGFLSS